MENPNPRLKVLVVDDTVVYRRILSDVVGSLEDGEVVGTAAHGRIALARLAQAPADLVLLDVEMPEMDGLEALREIRLRHPGTRVVMVSGTSMSTADITVRCLEQGALDFVRKPEGTDPEANRNELRDRLRPLLRHLRGRLRPGPALAPAPRPVPARPRLALAPARMDVVGIGVSTGGPNALAEVIPRLPADFPLPILLVQHMPPGFTASLAEHLAKRSALPVREARDGEAVRPGQVYIAPGGRHMVVRRPGGGGAPLIGLNDNPPENSCRPSVDVLFRSLAAQYDGHLLAVVMTGMGADGCEGVRAMKRKGCLCLTQAGDTCVINGMPQAVVEAGLADEQVPLDRLAERIDRAARARREA